LALLVGVAAGLTVAAHLALAPAPRAPPAAAEASVAFVGATSAPVAERLLLSRRGPDESLVSMCGGARRQNRYNKPKKLHPRTWEAYLQKKVWATERMLMKMTYMKEYCLETWSQTLKLNFPEGEDDVVTEEEVMEYFTTADYKPEAVIVGHKLPHDEQKHAYVHFATNEEAIKARKEKSGGSIGKASEVKVVYTDEKKWVRLRDGVSLQGAKRARYMKPYGWKAYPGYSDAWAEELGTRNHPVYPVD